LCTHIPRIPREKESREASEEDGEKAEVFANRIRSIDFRRWHHVKIAAKARSGKVFSAASQLSLQLYGQPAVWPARNNFEGPHSRNGARQPCYEIENSKFQHLYAILMPQSI
jgi:hypothetical protein